MNENKISHIEQHADFSISELLAEVEQDINAIAESSSRIEDTCNILIEYAKHHIARLDIGDERVQFIRLKRDMEIIRTTHRKIRVFTPFVGTAERGKTA